MFPRLPVGLLVLLASLCAGVAAEPASLSFADCFNEPASLPQKLDVTNVYAQVLFNEEMGRYLNLVVMGNSPQELVGIIGNSSSLATLFSSTTILTLTASTNSSYLCQNMRPPSPLPALENPDNSYCPIPAGPFAFSSAIPWGQNRELTTLITRLRAVDSYGKELLCIDMTTTPLEPRSSSPYGQAEIIFWSTVALAAAYWVVVGLARLAAAWNRGVTRPTRGIWSKAQSAGYIVASAVSGERLSTSPALMRFCTPSLRDVIFHTQWCAVLAMVAIEWPQFIYPLLTQTAWSTLSFNVTLVPSMEGHHWNPLQTAPFSPPAGFVDQVADPLSPLYIRPNVSNVIYTLPSDVRHGMSSFAYTIGLRPQDLFPTCMILFLAIIAGTMVISFFIWIIDYVISIATEPSSSGTNRLNRAKSPAFGNKDRDMPDTGSAVPLDENKSFTGSNGALASPARNARFALPLGSAGLGSERGIHSHRSWWRLRSDIGAFHGSVLHGNIVRILVLFHLPVTIFSCYHMTSLRGVASVSSMICAALSFVFFSVLIPAHLVIRVSFTTTNKLYDETKTLLALGPLYNHYRHGSQLFAILFFATNVAFGVTIGAGQKSGTAQAVVILVVEVVSALVTSIWLPWGSGASMGLISFLFCVARIVIAVLMVILTQAISIGAGPDGWVAYGILIILALVYLALLCMLITKVLEGLIRLFSGIGFHRSRHSVDTGLIGACGMMGCFGSRRRRHSKRRSRRHTVNGMHSSASATRDSDLSSYIPPAGGVIPVDGTATPPRFLGSSSRKGSMHSQPPSVLRPEHANRPYREDPLDNEEDGHIMNAWQPFGRSAGYVAVTQPPKPSTGFSRVTGGRSHIDSPYAITTGGSTHAFPLVGQQSQYPSPASVSSSALAGQALLYGFPPDSREDVQLSTTNVASTSAAVGVAGLPPGAMQPAHIRTKSQTAIVEDFSPSLSASGQSLIRHIQHQQPLVRQTHISEDSYLRPPEETAAARKFTLSADDDSGDEQDQQKKKKWYHLRRNRPHSSEGRPSATASSGSLALGGSSSTPAIDPELGGLGDSSQPQRSFVVIRKNQGSLAKLNQESGSSTPGAPNTYPRSGQRPPTR